MTTLKESPTPNAPEADHRSRKLRIIAIVAVVGIALLAFLTWWFVFRDTSAAGVDTSEAAEAREQALAEAAAEEAAAEEPTGAEPAEESTEPAVESNEPAPEPAEEPAAASLDGTWTVNTSIGTFDDRCLTEVCDTTFVGFRIDEELARIGAKTVVGRSPGVVGSMELEGSTITATEITVDMTQLITDDSSRTNAIRNQAIETNDFPEASFVLTQPIELGAVPEDGESIEIEATGDLTIHGVTRSETISLTAERAGEVIVVFGQLGPILLADYDIDKPQAAVVLSVEDNAIMEFQLFFTR